MTVNKRYKCVKSKQTRAVIGPVIIVGMCNDSIKEMAEPVVM